MGIFNPKEDIRDKRALKKAISKGKKGDLIIWDMDKERDKRNKKSNSDVIKLLNDQINMADKNKDEKEVQRLLRKRKTFRGFLKATTVEEN